jgi:hypothetical protein
MTKKEIDFLNSGFCLTINISIQKEIPIQKKPWSSKSRLKIPKVRKFFQIKSRTFNQRFADFWVLLGLGMSWGLESPTHPTSHVISLGTKPGHNLI